MEPADQDRAAGSARIAETQAERKSIRETDQDLGAADEACRKPRRERPHAERGHCRKPSLDRVDYRPERAGRRPRARYHRGAQTRLPEIQTTVEEFARRLLAARESLQAKVASTLGEDNDRGLLVADPRTRIHCGQAALLPKLA